MTAPHARTGHAPPPLLQKKSLPRWSSGGMEKQRLRSLAQGTTIFTMSGVRPLSPTPNLLPSGACNIQ